jgi:predicted AAA+ superfamily ATPase
LLFGVISGETDTALERALAETPYLARNFTFPEMMTSSWLDGITESRMVRWLRSGGSQELFTGIPLQDRRNVRVSRLLDSYLQFGAMPAIVDDALADEEKYDWLHDYIQTYLQRDLHDLANLRELEPFVRAQKALAGLTGECININNLAVFFHVPNYQFSADHLW